MARLHTSEVNPMNSSETLHQVDKLKQTITQKTFHLHQLCFIFSSSSPSFLASAAFIFLGLYQIACFQLFPIPTDCLKYAFLQALIIMPKGGFSIHKGGYNALNAEKSVGNDHSHVAELTPVIGSPTLSSHSSRSAVSQWLSDIINATVQGPVALPASASRQSRPSPTRRPTSFVRASPQVASVASMKPRECTSSARNATLDRSQKLSASLAAPSKDSMAFPRPSVETTRQQWVCAEERPLNNADQGAEMLAVCHGDQHDSRNPGQRD